jgi:hypothetical protein
MISPILIVSCALADTVMRNTPSKAPQHTILILIKSSQLQLGNNDRGSVDSVGFLGR